MKINPRRILLFILIIESLFFCSLAFANTATCQICNITYKVSSHNMIIDLSARSLDGRPLNYDFPDLDECHLCKGVYKNIEVPKNKINALSEFIWSQSYRKHIDANSWFRHALIFELIATSRKEIAEKYLAASWAAKDPETREAALNRSLQLYNKILDDPYSAHERKTEIKIIKGDILRQLEMFDEAKEWFGELASEPEFMAGWYPGLVKYQLELISNKKSLSVEIPKGNKLHYAVFEDNIDKVKSLSNSGQKINDVNMLGDTPLMLALRQRNASAAFLLINDSIDMTLADQDGNTYTHLALKAQETEILKKLLKNKSPIDIPNKSGIVPLALAVKKDNFKGFSLLIDAGADYKRRDVQGNSIYHILAQKRTNDVLSFFKLIQKLNIDINLRNRRGETALHIASLKSDEKMVRLLVSAGANINMRRADGETVLFFCRPELIPALIELNANMSIQNNAGYNPFIQSLLANDLQRLNYFKQTGLFGDDRIVYSTSMGDMSIYDAISDNNSNAVTEIITKSPGAVKEVCRKLGESPIHFAVMHSNFSALQTLLENGADVNAGNHYDRTPLHYAALKGNYDFVKMLVDFGANIYATDVRRSTPMHEAASMNNMSIFIYLSGLGAGRTTRNNNGFSPDDLLRMH